MVGGGLAQGNERASLVAAIFLGVASLTVLAVMQGVLGTTARSRFAGVSAGSLGRRGTRFVASPILAAMMIGWFGFNTALAGSGVAQLIHTQERIGVLMYAGLMLLVAWWGLDTVSFTALGAGVATLTLAIVGLQRALDRPHGPLLGDGRASGNLGLAAGVSIVVGYGAAFALRTPDFTHDLSRRRDVALCGLSGLALPLLGFVAAGAVLQLTTGTWDLVELLRRLGSPQVAYAFLAIGLAGSVLTNLHSGAVAIEDLAGRCSHRQGLVVVSALGTALALLDYTDSMAGFLTAMALAAPCLIGVLWIDRRRGVCAGSGIRGAAVAAWAAGATAGGATAFLARPLALPVGIAVGALVALTASARGM